jgi:hypothetical protein
VTRPLREVLRHEGADVKTRGRATMRAVDPSRSRKATPKEVGEWLDRELLEATITSLSPSQRRAELKHLLRKYNRLKKPRGRQPKWDKDRYIMMLLHLAGWRHNGVTRADAIDRLAVLERVGPEAIDERISVARKQIPPSALPEWARWILNPKAKPPVNR